MTNKKCLICEKNDYTVLYKPTDESRESEGGHYCCTSTTHGRHGQIVRCNNCELVYINPRMEDSEILDEYSRIIDEKYLSEKEYRRLTFRKSLNTIRKYKNTKGNLLDVGCYIGVFLEAAKNEGWNVYGIEPSHWAAEHARKSSLNVLEGTVKECEKFGIYFDVITLWDTIEHMTDPASDLKHLSKHLKDDGLIFFSTMNINSAYARLLGKRWPWYMDMHLYYFQPDTIKKLLEKSGLELVDITGYSHTISLNYLMHKLSAYNKIFQAINRIPILQRIGKTPVTIKLGDFMTVIAKKKKG